MDVAYCCYALQDSFGTLRYIGQGRLSRPKESCGYQNRKLGKNYKVAWVVIGGKTYTRELEERATRQFYNTLDNQNIGWLQPPEVRAKRAEGMRQAYAKSPELLQLRAEARRGPRSEAFKIKMKESWELRRALYGGSGCRKQGERS